MALAMPQNQTDALPVVTAAAAADPGDIVVTNGRMYRHWSPARTGINGIHSREFAFPPFGIQMWVAQGFSGDPLPVRILDFSGIGTFSFCIRRQLVGPVQPIGRTMSIRATPVAFGQSPIPFDIAGWSNAIPNLGKTLSLAAFNTAPALPADQYSWTGASNKPSRFGDTAFETTLVGGSGWVMFLLGPPPSAVGELEFWYLDIWGES